MTILQCTIVLFHCTAQNVDYTSDLGRYRRPVGNLMQNIGCETVKHVGFLV